MLKPESPVILRKLAPESLESAIVYDIETLPNVFTLNVLPLYGDSDMTFEVSHYRNDAVAMQAWFEYWRRHQTPMIGFNNLGFDYPVLHSVWNNPGCCVEEIYQWAQERIKDNSGFGTIWEDRRFAPQIDLYKMMHFDNKAKRTSLKALQFAMRSESVLEMPLPFDQPLTDHQTQTVLIPYNKHDVHETKRFALYNIDAIKFRLEIAGDMVKGDVVNWNDVKIGAKLVEQRLGDELCYTWASGKKEPRQTVREYIRINDIIFPTIQFKHPEFVRVLNWMRAQTLHADEVTERLKTKGVFTGVHATVSGIDFCFGTGGMHASVSSRCFVADDEWAVVDVDVAGMYPANMIANRLYPAHLGEKFVEVFAQLPIERAKYKKGTSRSNGLKLGGNGTFGNTNNIFSCFLDAQVTMATTINGQLLICMLAEWLLEVPTLEIIQANTDGITYRVHRSLVPYTRRVRAAWEALTRLVLEEVEYKRMWIRDVNNYVAESVDGKIKQKGAYWFPRKFPEDMAGNWHKDFSAQVVVKAAVEHMVNGVDIEDFVYGHRDPFDFMCRAKVDRSCRLMIGDREVQRITRYYLATNGAPMVKVARPKGTPGAFKRKNKLTDAFYYSILNTLPPNTWDERIHSKNKACYPTETATNIEAGHLVAECNVASHFEFGNVNYEWYIDQARKLVIA